MKLPLHSTLRNLGFPYSKTEQIIPTSNASDLHPGGVLFEFGPNTDCTDWIFSCFFSSSAG